MPLLRHLGTILLSITVAQAFALFEQAVVVKATHRRKRTAASTPWYHRNGDTRCSIIDTVLKQAGLDSVDALSTDIGGGVSIVPLLVITALGLGFGAQGWINQQLNGDQGLGAFLKDGRGYQNSSFRPLTDGDRAASGNDPLPWLSLPQLDFVEVAGQETNGNNANDDAILKQLEGLRVEMNEELEQGNVVEASILRRKLESLMRDNGIEFQADQ